MRGGKKKFCEICGGVIDGAMGIDFQIVNHGGKDNYYHQECIDIVWKGVTDVQGQDTEQRQQILGSG